MSLKPKGLESNKINSSSKVTTLNPNAAEFVPSALRSTYGNTKGADSSRVESTGTSGKAILGRTESSNSNNSDDEERQYWCDQLPDDITPDFKAMKEDEVPSPGQLSLAGFSIRDGPETSKFSASIASETFGTQHGRSLLGTNNLIFSGNIGYSGSTYNEDQSSTPRIVSPTNSWDKQFINGDQQLTRGMEGQHYNGDSGASFVNNMLGDQAVIENSAIDPVEFLSSKFSGFSAESLADIYFTSGCDLHATIRMIGQLEVSF